MSVTVDSVIEKVEKVVETATDRAITIAMNGGDVDATPEERGRWDAAPSIDDVRSDLQLLIEPLHLIGRTYRRAGLFWRATELRRRHDYSVDPVPYPHRPWQVLLSRTGHTDAYWVLVEDLEQGRTRFVEVDWATT